MTRGSGPEARRTTSAVGIGSRAGLVLVASSVLALLAFVWPLVLPPPAATDGTGHGLDAPAVFVVVLPVLLVLMLAELSSGGIDAKALAMLGVLSAIGAALRPLGAGLLPPARGRLEIVLLMAYGAVAALAFGLLMNLWFWPFLAGGDSAISYVPGAPIAENLGRLVLFSLATSAAWDIGRAITTVLLVGLTGSAVLAVLRRASRRAAFGAAPVFGT